ncbi:MAG: magnesium-translocating P-type ATPase [Rubrivivax sp.]|nr:magnesium-translocating P-type ATPase [Rubrivivax sp.]
MSEDLPYWSLPADEMLARLGSSASGLPEPEAAARLANEGPNVVRPQRDTTLLHLALRQFASPLVLILVVGAVISLFVHEWWDAVTILVILLGSAALGFAQEARASAAMARLRERLALTCRARRGGTVGTVPAASLVPGDIVELSAGNLVPADGVVLASRDFLVVESSLTGESLPVEKRPGQVPAGAPLRERANSVFLGSSVRSGTASVLVVRTGRRTAMGGVAARLAAPAPEGDFARGVRHFGELLLRVMLAVVVAVLVVNQWLGRPVIDSLLFAMALAVGLSPELLPAIVSVALSGGARRLNAAGVLVRRLEAIEDLGGMDVLCTDKTGTLTTGLMALEAAVDTEGAPSREVLQLACLNASFETGIENPMDVALVAASRDAGLTTAGWSKVDEIPYDFVRKRLTIVAQPMLAGGAEARHCMIVKGAAAPVLGICREVAQAGGRVPLTEALRQRLADDLRAHGERGVRVLALATREGPPLERYEVADETGLTLRGFLLFADPPKPEAADTLRALAARGVRVKILTGDNRHVAAHVGATLGLDPGRLLTGEAIAGLRDEALWHLAETTDLFVELEPAQKERIVRALQHRGHAVGYLGDGINDAPALHAADVGISVDQAVDVARESADLVLLRPDLALLLAGIVEGRRTFANTMKYIAITTSANFGNMVSMALVTPLLPFLPLTATQILLNNLLSDLPSLALSTDAVDEQHLQRAQRWDVHEVRRFMIAFGLTSSVFDLAAFALLMRGFEADAPLFHSAWFVLSLLTELAVVLVLRTRLPVWRSRPGALLVGATVAMALVALALPYVPPAARWFGLVPLAGSLLATMLVLVVAYALATEGVKHALAASARKAHPA